ncbi:cytochrome c-type biogenesis protein [Ereboglobus sp. PH5-10]|uniref:cytochrome c biogenesis CcdA family protein n=1 Tax=Ereboglobus sp. PH5-10 TaxID=2940629 RepID=UPI0024056708|nr:cytochrome c biogenesis protein CcdA [Ereboglobus sp. PH5-10]MDF9828532.1 cytochrome c-type biogenesis protein [Ereboglobus sp. PH5-10]
MENLFISLTDAMSGAPLVALCAAFAWGVLSIVLSPCHLASIPLIVAFLQGGATVVSTLRAMALSMLFALGILVSIAVIGGLTAAAGRMLGDLGSWGNYGVAVVFFVFGLYLLDILRLPEMWRPAPNQKRRGPVGALVFGLVFGLALGPCTFGFMAPVLGVTFRVSATQTLFALGLLAMFGIGHCSVIALAGTSTTLVQRWLSWQNDSSAGKWLRRGCGALIITAGIYLIVSAH